MQANGNVTSAENVPNDPYGPMRSDPSETRLPTMAHLLHERPLHS